MSQHKNFPATDPHTKDIDATRNHSPIIAENTKKITAKLLEEDNLDIMKLACWKYFSWSKFAPLREFFIHHPTRWSDLQRIVHTHVITKDSTGDKSLDPSCYNEIYALFIINGNHHYDTTYEKLRPLITEIIHNMDFLGYCSNQPSLLDSTGYTLTRISSRERVNYIQKLIEKWLIKNIEGCTPKNVETYFIKILPIIFSYIPRIFGRESNHYAELYTSKTITELSKRMHNITEDHERKGYGKRRTDMMRILQAFHAWGNISEIEKAHNNAEKYAEKGNMWELLSHAGIILCPDDKITVEQDALWNKRYIWSITINNATYPFIWRAKSTLSALHKLWETPEFTNINANRDMLGATIIFDKTSKKEKLDVLARISTVYPNYGYIMKTKWLFIESELTSRFKQTKTYPMDITSRKWDTTNPKLNNASLGGFVKIDKLPICWFEVQCIDKNSYDWKQKDDKRYKIYGIINLLTRGEKFITPNDLSISFWNLLFKQWPLQVLTHLIKNEWKYKWLKINSPNDLIYYCILEGKLIPFHNNSWEVIFVTPKTKNAFQGMMNSESWKEYMQDDQSNWKWLLEYIKSSGWISYFD